MYKVCPNMCPATATFGKGFYKTYLNYSLTNDEVKLILSAKNPA